jgi:hypothetical protein
MRSIAVLVNGEALRGGAERDDGGIYYDLGHGYIAGTNSHSSY